MSTIGILTEEAARGIAIGRSLQIVRQVYVYMDIATGTYIVTPSDSNRPPNALCVGYAGRGEWFNC